MSRRSTLQPNPNFSESTTRKQKLLDLSKPINPTALQGVKVANTGMLAPTGYSLIFVTSPEGYLSPVLILTGDMPQTYSIEDYQRIQQARGLAGGESNALSRASVLNEVTSVITSRLADSNVMPKLKPEAQSEVLRLRSSNNRLEKNLAFLEKAPPSVYKDLLTRHLTAAVSAVNSYLLENQLTSVSEDKLNAYLLKKGCPRWIFSRFSESEEPELAKRDSLSFYFPKKVSKGLQLYVSEIESNLEFMGPLRPVIDPLVAILAEFKVEKDKDSTKLYVPPMDVINRFEDLESIPSLPRTAPKACLAAVAIIEAIVANYPPLLVTAETLKDHGNIFRKDTAAMKPFAYAATDPRSVKVQYLEHVQRMAPNEIVQTDEVWNRFMIPKKVKVIDLTPGKPATAVAHVNFFRAPTKAGTSDAEARAQLELKISEALPNLVPPKKRLRGGPQQQPLTPAAKKLIAVLNAAVKTKSVHPDFVENVSTFLRGFFLPAMMDLAVRVLTATIESREIIPDVENPPEGGSDEEGSLPNL